NAVLRTWSFLGRSWNAAGHLSARCAVNVYSLGNHTSPPSSDQLDQFSANPTPDGGLQVYIPPGPSLRVVTELFKALIQLSQRNTGTEKPTGLATSRPRGTPTTNP